MWHCAAKLKNLSVALLSQAKKKYEFGTAQPRSCIAGDNVQFESVLKWLSEETNTRIKVFCHTQTKERNNEATYGGSTLPKNVMLSYYVNSMYLIIKQYQK